MEMKMTKLQKLKSISEKTPINQFDCLLSGLMLIKQKTFEKVCHESSDRKQAKQLHEILF